MNRLALVLAILLALVPCALAEGSLSAETMRGSGVIGVTENAILAIRPVGQAPALQLDATSGSIRIVDDRSEGAMHRPDGGGPATTSLHFERFVDEIPFEGSTLHLGAVTDDDAVVLVMPASSRFFGRFEHLGPYSIAPVEDTLLERSHLFGQNRFGTDYHDVDYQYTSGAGLQTGLLASSSAPSSLVFEGDFVVYVWGIAVQTSDGGSYRTGYYQDYPAEPVRAYTNDHYVHAMVKVQGGHLEMLTSAAVDLYGPSFTLQTAGLVQYGSASGAFRSSDGTVTAQGGTLEATSGTYELSGDGAGRLHVAVREAPADVHGDSVTVTPVPPMPREAQVAIGLGTLAVLALAVYVSPAVLGTRRLSGIGTPGPMGWRARRAEGYAGLAARAEGRHRARRAAFWSGLAARSQPSNPDRSLTQAVHLRDAGRFDAALQAHGRAHFWLQAGGDQGQLAHNAYEAARAAARAGRLESALDWLRIAVEADPWLGAQLGREPDFAPLRGWPDYASLTVRGAPGWVTA